MLDTQCNRPTLDTQCKKPFITDLPLTLSVRNHLSQTYPWHSVYITRYTDLPLALSVHHTGTQTPILDTKCTSHMDADLSLTLRLWPRSAYLVQKSSILTPKVTKLNFCTKNIWTFGNTKPLYSNSLGIANCRIRDICMGSRFPLKIVIMI